MDTLDSNTLFSLSGRVAIVTGASSGLGATLARAAAENGALVLATARRAEALENLANSHPNIIPVVCDITRDEQRAALMECASKYGGADVLVNNAGTIGDIVGAECETAEDIQRTIEVNLIAPLKLSQSVQPGMRERGSGSIINIASISGLVGIGRLPQASYVASKSGLVGLTRELAVQWARYGIRVNTIAAGYFESEMTAPLFESEKMASWVEARTPLPLRGQPKDFVGTMLLLASDASRFITGQTFAVDGGWTAQ